MLVMSKGDTSGVINISQMSGQSSVKSNVWLYFVRMSTKQRCDILRGVTN